MMPPKPLRQPPASPSTGAGPTRVPTPARVPVPARVPTPTSEPAAAPVAAEVRQRWRLTVQRRADAPALPSKELLAAWEAGFAGCGLPIAGLELPAARPRIVFGAPLPAGMAADRELLDVFLTERLAVAEVREALAGALPPGHVLLDIHDVWLGEQALPGQVVAADYRVRVAASDGPPLERASLQAACDELTRAPALPRTRDKGGRAIAYDLRPLFAGASASAVEADGRATLRIRTRFDPERGVGRPEEVVAAIGEALARSLEVLEIVRERVLLVGEA